MSESWQESASPDDEAVSRLRAALETFAANDAATARGRWWSGRCMVGVGNRRLLVEVVRGVPTLSELAAPLSSWDFAIVGSVRAWNALWQDPPPPGWHDLFALAKRGEMRIEGALQPFMAHLQYVKDMLSAPRHGRRRS